MIAAEGGAVMVEAEGEEVDIDPAILAEIRALATSGRKMEAIKRLRDVTDFDLARAKDFVESLTDGNAGRVVDYKNTRGEPFRMALDQLITHVVNHGTHHRAETGMLLERIGRSPGDMDYVYYLLRP